MSKISTDTSTKVDITSKVGDSFYLKASLTDDNDVAIDVNEGFVITLVSMTIVDSNGDSALSLTSTSVPADIVISSDALTFMASSTKMNLRAGSYTYYVLLSQVTALGVTTVTTILNGKLKMK